MSDDLIRGHHDFHARYVAHEGEFLRHLAGAKQNPNAIYVGCSDSRVVPELLTSSTPGELFVVRNVANLVPPLDHADASVGAALEYAVGVLHVPHIVVCGHYGCGGVRAVIDGLDKLHGFPSLEEWLRDAEQPVARARAALPDADAEALWPHAVEENVVAQLAHLVTFPHIAEALDAGRLDLHAWVYDLFTARLLVYDADADRFVAAETMLAR